MPLSLGVRSFAWIFGAAGLATASIMGAVVAFNSPPVTFRAFASGDAYLSSVAPTAHYGVSPVLWVSTGGGENWTLIQFPIAGRLRPGDLVVQARIELTVSNARAASWPVVITTGRTLTSWQENLTTFSTAPLFAFDTSTATVVGTSGAPSQGAVVSIDVTKQLHRWHSYGGPSNFGTVIMMGAGVSNGAIGFASRENPNLNKPVVVVTFQPGPRTPYGYSLGFGSIWVAVTRSA